MRSPQAANLCRELCRRSDQTVAGAPQLLALIGDLDDLALIDGNGVAQPRWPDLIAAMGILGNVQAVPLLIGGLRSKDEKIRIAISRSLELMLRAGLREAAAVQVADDDEGGEPGTSSTVVERISTSADAWAAWWHQHHLRFDAHTRWRRGRPFESLACLEEIEDPASHYDQRQRAAWELSMHLSADIPFEPDWFVFYQHLAIKAWRDKLRSSSP
jgi:hypothetical protein